jgi:flagellar basal body-associated protein FliL
MTVKELYEKVNNGVIQSEIDLQREIVYDTKKQELVIDSLINGIPLPAFYLWEEKKNEFQVLDGKQRIEAIKQFYQNNIPYNGKLWKQTDTDFQNKLNNIELTIILCKGSEELKREIFRRINTLGVPLSPFEVLNGLYNGVYLKEITKFAANIPGNILGSNTRGKIQLQILKWLCKLKREKDISAFVKSVQHDSFVDKDQIIITQYAKFIKDVFDNYSNIDILFDLAVNYLKDKVLWKEHKTEINKRIIRYLKSDDAKLTDKRTEIEDIIQAIVNGVSVDDKRLFTKDDKDKLLELQNSTSSKYKCKICQQEFYFEELTVDHIKAWSKGGRTVLSNAQLLCRACNSKKSNH